MKPPTYRIRVNIASGCLLGEINTDLHFVLSVLRFSGLLHANKDFPRFIEYTVTHEPSEDIASWKRLGFDAHVLAP